MLTVAELNKTNADSVINMLLLAQAAGYKDRLGVDSSLTNDPVSSTENIIRAYFRNMIETDSCFAGRFSSCNAINYNKYGQVSFISYSLDDNIVDMYARIISMIITMKSSCFLKKLFDQVLYTTGDTSPTEPIPFSSGFTKDSYKNYSSSTRRGVRNRLSPYAFLKFIYKSLLNTESLIDGSFNRIFLNNEWADFVRLKNVAFNEPELFNSSGGLSPSGRRLSYIPLALIRLFNSIDYTRRPLDIPGRVNYSNFVNIVSTDTSLLPIYDSLMMMYNYPIYFRNGLLNEETQGAFDITSSQRYLEDLYGFSDQYFSTLNVNLDLALLNLADLNSMYANTTRESFIASITEAMIESIRFDYTGTANQKNKALFEDLIKLRIGSMESKWILYHTILGKDYFRYPQLPLIATNQFNATRRCLDFYDPNQYKPGTLMYLAGPDFDREIHRLNNKTITLQDVSSHDQDAISVYHPANLIARLFSVNNPEEVLGFRVSPIPTAEEFEMIRRYIASCKLVFSMNDPNQSAIRMAADSTGNSALDITRRYKAAMAVSAYGSVAPDVLKSTAILVKNTISPFSTPILTSGMIRAKHKIFYESLQEAL